MDVRGESAMWSAGDGDQLTGLASTRPSRDFDHNRIRTIPKAHAIFLRRLLDRSVLPSFDLENLSANLKMPL